MPAALPALFQARFGDVRVFATPEDPIAAEAFARVAGRRGCRSYSTRPVPDGLVETLIATALSSPSKSDLQQADIVWVRDPAIRAEVIDGIANSAWIMAAPVFFVICANGRRFAETFAAAAQPFANHHFDAAFNAIVDGAIVLGQLAAMAAIAGLGTCPVSEIRNRPEQVSGALRLPERVIPIAGFCLGYPGDAGILSPRLSLTVTSHVDRYDADAFARLTGEYDARRARQHPYAKQRDVDQFGTAAFYSWSEDKRRQYATPQRADFGAFVRSKGFSLD